MRISVTRTHNVKILGSVLQATLPTQAEHIPGSVTDHAITPSKTVTVLVQFT